MRRQILRALAHATAGNGRYSSEAKAVLIEAAKAESITVSELLHETMLVELGLPPEVDTMYEGGDDLWPLSASLSYQPKGRR